MCWLQTAECLRNYPHFVLALMALVALVECVAGYRAWKLLLGLNGAIMGFFAGVIACMFINPFLAPLGAVLGISACAVLCATVEPVGAFVFAMATGISLAMVSARICQLAPDGIMPFAIAAGVMTWLGTVLLGRRAIILITAFAGAQQLVSEIGAFMRSLAPYQSEPGPCLLSTGEVLTFVLLVAMGVAVQWATTHRVPPRCAPQRVETAHRSPTGAL